MVRNEHERSWGCGSRLDFFKMLCPSNTWCQSCQPQCKSAQASQDPNGSLTIIPIWMQQQNHPSYNRKNPHNQPRIYAIPNSRDLTDRFRDLLGQTLAQEPNPLQPK